MNVVESITRRGLCKLWGDYKSLGVKAHARRKKEALWRGGAFHPDAAIGVLFAEPAREQFSPSAGFASVLADTAAVRLGRIRHRHGDHPSLNGKAWEMTDAGAVQRYHGAIAEIVEIEVPGKMTGSQFLSQDVASDP